MKTTQAQTTKTSSEKSFNKKVTATAQSDQPAMENGNLVSALYHHSKEIGSRSLHDPTRMEAAEFNIKTVEISDYNNTSNIKSLGKLIGTLIDQNKFQQDQIGKLMVRIQELEKQN
jgi:hypothetical protein